MLQKEKQAREEAEKQRRDLEDRLKKYEDDMEKHRLGESDYKNMTFYDWGCNIPLRIYRDTFQHLVDINRSFPKIFVWTLCDQYY